MKTLTKRLRRLEESHAAQTNQQGLTPVEVLRGRIRRRLEAAGEQYVEEPAIDYGPGPFSLAEILRLRYKERVSLVSVAESLDTARAEHPQSLASAAPQSHAG